MAETNKLHKEKNSSSLEWNFLGFANSFSLALLFFYMLNFYLLFLIAVLFLGGGGRKQQNPKRIQA